VHRVLYSVGMCVRGYPDEHVWLQQSINGCKLSFTSTPNPLYCCAQSRALDITVPKLAIANVNYSNSKFPIRGRRRCESLIRVVQNNHVCV
jgi:hypothetical protein